MMSFSGFAAQLIEGTPSFSTTLTPVGVEGGLLTFTPEIVALLGAARDRRRPRVLPHGHGAQRTQSRHRQPLLPHPAASPANGAF